MRDLERSLRFYVELLGMRVLRREDYSRGRFTLAFLGYSSESSGTVLELTHNWDQRVSYELGNGFGHLAIAVASRENTCAELSAREVPILRQPGPMSVSPDNGRSPEPIAFVADPDGYRIELIERA